MPLTDAELKDHYQNLIEKSLKKVPLRCLEDFSPLESAMQYILKNDQAFSVDPLCKNFVSDVSRLMKKPLAFSLEQDQEVCYAIILEVLSSYYQTIKHMSRDDKMMWVQTGELPKRSFKKDISCDDRQLSCQYMKFWYHLPFGDQAIEHYHVYETQDPETIALHFDSWLQANEAIRHLEKLDLRSTNLLYVPALINCFTRLKELNLSNSSLCELPKDFHLPKLRLLNCENTHLKEIPENFDLPELRILYLGNTHIEKLPEGFNPPKLRILHLEHTRIQVLPRKFFPEKLKGLYLSYTRIQELPGTFNLPFLQWLCLEGSGIQRLPEGFNPPALRSLVLSRTHIHRLPKDFNPMSLIGLYLEYSHIKSLPNNFNPPQLKWLHLEYTPIKFLPENFKPPRLDVVYTQGTQLDQKKSEGFLDAFSRFFQLLIPQRKNRR